MIDWIGNRLKKLLSPLTKFLAYYRIPPNFITFAGFALSIAAGYFFARGHFVVGGFLLLFSGLLDMIDGELSRITNLSTRFGAFLDSTLDRLSECFIFIGIAIHFSQLHTSYFLLTVIALCGSLMVSYTRARAESLSVPGRVGLFERGVRLFLLFVGSVIGVRAMVIIMLILSIGTFFTIIQRIFFVYRHSR